ncbi:MAG: hypothetical protein R6U52_01475 [Kosmotogaceae bacterium]
MVQQTGETRDAIIDEDNKQIEAIISANKRLKDPYWIVVFAKPSKTDVEGLPTLLKHIKAYKTKPTPQVGMISGRVDNSKGTVDWEVNMPQRPFDFDALQKYGAKPCDEAIVETTTIPGAYVTK